MNESIRSLDCLAKAVIPDVFMFTVFAILSEAVLSGFRKIQIGHRAGVRMVKILEQVH